MRTETLEEVFDKFGITARAEARGKAQGIREGETRGIQEGKVQVAQNLIKKRWDSEAIAETTQLDLPTVESLMGRSE